MNSKNSLFIYEPTTIILFYISIKFIKFKFIKVVNIYNILLFEFLFRIVDIRIFGISLLGTVSKLIIKIFYDIGNIMNV